MKFVRKLLRMLLWAVGILALLFMVVRTETRSSQDVLPNFVCTVAAIPLFFGLWHIVLALGYDRCNERPWHGRVAIGVLLVCVAALGFVFAQYV